MSLVKREHRPAWPLDMVAAEDRVDKVFRDVFRNVFGGEGPSEWTAEGRIRAMRVEEYLDGETCVVRAELPGIDPDKDVDISVVDGMLHLRAEREERKEEERPDGYRSEFHYGSLERSFRLPEGATEADITATYQDGILEVRVPAPKQVDKPVTKIPIARR